MTAVDRVDDVAGAVARAGWAALLPPHRTQGDDVPTGAPVCVDVLALSHRHAVVLVADASGSLRPVPVVLGDARGVRRAAPGDGAAEALLALLAGGVGSGRFVTRSWQPRGASGERGVTVDQTNESVVVGDAAVVKWSAVADPGPHPAPSLLALLEDGGFTGMPHPWGVLEWLPPDGSAPRLLAMAADYVTGAVDGWTWAVEVLRAAAASRDLRPAEEAGAAVGSLVSSFHHALAGTAVPVDESTARAWVAAGLADLERALAVSTGPARAVLANGEAAVRSALSSARLGTAPLIRVHGDLHVGQVLRADGSGGPAYLLTDFDGNPVVPPEERSRPQPAAVDVAGMAQSLLHAGLVVRRHHPDLDPADVDAAAAAARSAFLASYRAGLGDQHALLDESMLRPLALRQVCREFVYAATHLPRWSYVPEAALPALLAEHP